MNFCTVYLVIQTLPVCAKKKGSPSLGLVEKFGGWIDYETSIKPRQNYIFVV
jgi:hypothetical protein